MARQARMYASAVDITARTQGDRVEALLALAYELEEDRSDQRLFRDATAFFSARDMKLSRSTWWKVRSPKYLVSSYSFLLVLAEFLDVEPQVIAREDAVLPDDMGEGLAMLRAVRVQSIIDFAEQQIGDLGEELRAKLLKDLS